MAIKVELNGGLDIGNGYVKALVESKGEGGKRDTVDMPSAVAILTRPNQIPTSDEDAVEVLTGEGADFFNQLDASFDSPLIPDSYRRVFGMRSLGQVVAERLPAELRQVLTGVANNLNQLTRYAHLRQFDDQAINEILAVLKTALR